jgi:hypothetical protein
VRPCSRITPGAHLQQTQQSSTSLHPCRTLLVRWSCVLSPGSLPPQLRHLLSGAAVSGAHTAAPSAQREAVRGGQQGRLCAQPLCHQSPRTSDVRVPGYACCRAQAFAFLISDRSPFVVGILCPLRACLDHLKLEDACLSYGTAPLRLHVAQGMDLCVVTIADVCRQIDGYGCAHQGVPEPHPARTVLEAAGEEALYSLRSIRCTAYHDCMSLHRDSFV